MEGKQQNRLIQHAQHDDDDELLKRFTAIT